MFSLRIVSTSHYQADPLADLDVLYSSFRSTAVRKVPVLRIFGATPAGQKTCMHVHGVFPYLYAPYDGTQPVDSYLRRFAASLDKAINVANNSQANIQHVFKVSLVAGIPMYGYHAEEQQFLKIYLYNPSTVRKTADLLLGGAVMNKSFQPHESHIPFPLQLFMDYNLYGMNMINVAAVKFRRKKADTDSKQHRSRTPERGEGSGDVSVEGGSPLFSRNTPSSSSSTTTNTPSLAHWDMEHIQSDLLLPDHVERQSTCELEVDVIAADILNRKEVTDNMGKNPGLAAIWEDERQRRRDVGQPSQITPQQSQEHDQVEVSTSERELLDRFREILQQQQALRRSESEESEMSIEESTLSPEDISCIPASQLEDHSQSASNQDSQDSQQSSQGTVVLGEEEGDEDGEGVVISLESIQRVVSFSQSFSRPGSQPSSSSTPQEGEAADQTLIDVLAALAEESSPSASQRCAAQVEALEDRDSVVGQGVAVPPDSDALQEDLEETLHMSQTLPEDSEDYNTDGLEATWDGSPNQQLKDRFLVDSHEARNDDENDDNDDDLIPQLDGASDQKPASKKPGKKRLGVRGPVLSTHTAGARQRRRSSQGGVGDALKGQTPPPASCPTDSSANSCEQSSKAHPPGTPSMCSPKFSQSSGVGGEDTDTVSCASAAKIPQESSQGTDTCSSQKQATDSCHPLSSKYSCAVSLQLFTSSDSINSGPQLSSQKTEEDSDDDSDDNIPLVQIERLHKQTSSLPPVTTTSCEEEALSPGKEDAVSMEVCGKDSESCPQQEGNMDCSGGSSSNSSGCVVRMEKVDKLSRPKKLALSLNKLRHLSHDNGISSPLPVPSPPSSPCCFTIPLPTPVYKRLKMRGVFTDTRHEVQYVRVRPIDICQTDLQKIGQEILRLTRLTQKEFNHLGIAVERCEDEEGTVTEKEASASGQPGEVKISPVPRDKASSSSIEGAVKGRRGKHRRLMGPKCKRKTAGSSGRDKISCTDPQTAGMSDHQQEISGDSVHTPVSESGAAPMHTPSTSVTCTDAAVSVASDDGRNAFGWQPLVTDCLSSVKGDDPCHKRLTCKCPGFSSADDKEVTVSIDSHRQGDSSSHLEDYSLASPSSVRDCKCERLPSSNQCSCGASPWSPPVSTASPSSVSASVPVSSSPCQKDSGGSPSCSQSHSDLCSGGDRDQRDTTSSTTLDSRSGSPHFASTNISTSGVGANDGLPLSQQRHCSSQSGSSSCPSGAVSVTSDLSHLPLSHSNPVTTSACSQEETLPTTSVCAVVCSRSPVHQSQHSAGSKQVPECCPRGDQGSSIPTPESVQTAGTFTCLQGSADSISSPVHQQESPKNLQLALDAVCLETSRNSMLPDRQNDDKNAVKNTDLDEKAETESEHLIHNSDVQVNSSTSDNDLCGKSQGKTDRRNSNSGSSSKMPLEVDSKDLPFIPPMRHSAVRLWSLGDSDSESEVSEDSSDDYCPTKAQKKKRKRKGSKQQTKTGIKRPKWSSVNNSTHSNSRCIGHDGENKHARKKKNARNKGKENMQELIEGVHYIVVGKFKGHRIMLVKLERVKVNLNERVKVSDCWGKKVSDLRENKAEAGAKAKPRLLGPRCRRLANGVSASDPSLMHIPKQEEPAASSDSESDTSPVPDRNANSPVLSENEPGACEELTEKSDGPQQKNETVNTEELHLKGMLNAEKLREQDDTVNIKKLQQCNSYVNIEKLEKQYIDELQRQNGHVNTVELKQMNGNVDGDKEVEQLNSGKNEDLLQPDKITNGDTIQDTSKKDEKLPEKDIVEISRLQLGELVARQRKRKKGLSRVSSAPCNLKSTAGKESKSAGEGMVEHPPEDFQTHDLSTESGQTVGKVAKSAGKNQAARRRSSSSSLACVMVMSDDGESSQEGNSGVHSPLAVDMDTDSRMAASESTSLTQSPVPKTDQQSDLPFTISEHSQDADCSSLPQSNPDSTSSSPAFPRMALTCTESEDKHESLTQTSPAVRLTNKEVCEGESLSSTVFCFQAVCDKVKEVRSCQRAVDGSSDSSDWQDSLDAMQPTKDGNNSQSLSFSFKDKLQSGENLTADLDKEKLKKQKKLSPNQRLGVAFLPKRRRKGKMKNGKMKSEVGTGSTKVMDSLSLLHMATLASLDAEAGSKQDLKFPCTPWRLGSSSKTEGKENHNTITLQRSTDNSSPWKTSICSTGDNEAKYDTSAGVEFTLNPEKGPDHSDSQVMENNTRTGEEPSNSQNQNLAHPIANMTAGIEHKGRDGENSSEETDDYQISECAENLKEEKPHNSANAKKKVISSENSEASTSRESESRSDHKVEEKNTGSVRRRSNKVQPPLYEDSDEKTDDYTGKMSMKRSASIKQLSGYRKRKIKRKPTVQKPDKSKNKVLDSLDVLHMATLASLGTDPPPSVHDDTMPRYSDSVWDHNKDYEESLIKMSYTSPVHSDLADLSPPIPLSPEDLSKVNLSTIQKQRAMPCRAKVDEAKGTRLVCMAQVRAENAAERASRRFVPISSPNQQVNGAARGLVQDVKHPGLKSSSVLCRTAIRSAAQPGSVKSPHAPSTSVHAAIGSQTLSSSCQTAQPTIPNPEKLPTPSIPWHHPLHVVTDGAAWKEQMPRDKFNSRNPSLGDGALPSKTHHSSYSMRGENRHSSLSSSSDTPQPAVCLKSPPFSAGMHREIRNAQPSPSASMNSAVDITSPRSLQSHGSSLRRPSVSYGPLGEIHNHLGSRPLPFTSLAQMYAQRDRGNERSPSISGEASGVYDQSGEKSPGCLQPGMKRMNNAHPSRSGFHGDSYLTTPPSSSQSSGGPFSWSSQSPSSRRESGEILHCSTKSPPVSTFSPRDLHTMAPQPSPSMAPQPSPSMAPQPSPSGIKFHWSRSVDSIEGREIRSQRSEIRSQRDEEVKRQRIGEVRSQRDREIRSQRDAEIRSSIEEPMMVEKTVSDSCGLPTSTPTKWLSDISNMAAANQQGKPNTPSQQTPPLSHYSPRLSRTEMVISQMFNLDSGSNKPMQMPSPEFANSVPGDRWQESKLGMPSSGWRSAAHDQQREPSTDRLQRQLNAPLTKTSPATPWEKPPVSFPASVDFHLAQSQHSATPCYPSRSDCSENLPTGYSPGAQKSSVASKYDSCVRSALSDNSPPRVMFTEKGKADESPSSAFCETSPLAVKSQSSDWYQPTSSSVREIRSDQFRSASAYDTVNCLPKSTRSYSSPGAKWPEYFHENRSSFMLNSSSHLSEKEKEVSKSTHGFGAEKNLYRSMTWSSSVADEYLSGVKPAEPCSKSPLVSPPTAPVSTITSCSKSPGKGSPRGRLLENTRPGKTELWHQQSRKRSIGDYMQEMIETAYAKVSPGKPPCSWSEVPREDCSYPVRSEEGDRTHATSVNGLTSSALDLTMCSGKFQNTGLYMSGSLSAQRPHTTRATEMCSSASIDVPSGYAAVSVPSMASSSYHTSAPSLAGDTATVMSCTSSVLPVSSSTASHPTWTSIKTDDFENITDDEDEEVIPSSQGYSTNAYRFPGFRRLSSISSSWTPYTLHNPHTLAAVSKTPSQTSKDVSGGGSVMETLSGHSYSSSMYGYSKGLYSQCNGVSQSSKVNCEQGLGPAEASQDPGRESVTQRLERGEYSVVSSLGTPWRESQPPASAPTSQFEPITDSEEEEDNTPKVTPHSHMRMSQYLNSSSSSAAFTGSSFFPAHSGMMASTAYSSASTSAMGLVSTSVHPPLQNKPPLPSSLLNRQDSGNSSASTREIGRSFLTIRSYSLDQPLSPSEGVAGGVDSLSNVNNDNMKRSMLVCGEDGGDRHDDSEPEDVGGRKRRKKAGPSPSDKPSASQPGPRREEGEKQEEDSDNMGQSGWPRNPEGTAGPVEIREASRHVLCPKAPPPSRRSVEASAASVGLSVEPTQPAFCSHPPDLPDAPRELGGRVLHLPTNMVKELEELPPPGEGGRGLGAWRALKVADSPLLFSQQQQRPSASSSSSSLSLHSEPQLRFALAGDHPCVITPVRPPPSCSRVTAWLKETLQKMSPSCGKTQLKSPERGEEAWGREGETSMPLDIDVPVEEEVGVSRDSDGEEEEEDSMFTRLRDRTMKPVQGTSRKVAGSDDDNEDRPHGSSTPKRQRLDEEGILRHSTPVGRRSSSDLFDLTCTPISGGRKGESSGGQGETTDSGFVTPKHPPLRRLSTNTQAALTKAILTADQRQQSFEGEVSQIDAPTPRNTHGFKVTQQNLQNAKALHKHQFLTVLSMELHADSRGDLMPDPEVDDIRVVFYAVFDDIPPERGRQNMTGAIVVDRESCRAQGVRDHHWQPSTSAVTGGGAGSKRLLFEKCAVEEELDVVYVESELELLEHFAQLIVRLDPDILLGFEVQQMSWGFLLQRAAQLSVNLCSQIARIHGSKQGNRFSAEKDEWGADHTSEIHIEGRIVLNLWRLLRHEVTLNIYSYENCAFHILHHRLPAYTPRSLTSWYNHRTHLHAWRVVDYYTQRVRGQLAMMDQLDLIGKTSEFARVFGIEFYDVLSRGTQYRVESMMLRLAKPLNFIPVSPSVQQRARQKAAECSPLTLEPKSRVYTEPMVVLDFQSLYPSIMIAYNYCFSTCLGRLEQLAHASEGPLEFGCTSLRVTPETLKKIRKHVTISPNGCVFVTGKVRRGVLPMMVEEILKTRLMVKKSMKDYKDDKSLHRMLNARQLGLKLIANTTYGYTGASFSGRMPCIEVGDSIVRKARESLERAIHLVKDTAHWRAEVVYGDTDSLFIRLPGRSKDEAFVLGQEIADAVTNMFPKPMKLKFEKVYLPCVLQTKKRYVGFMYETRDQQEAVFDAKGIETVRRDNCGVVSKVLERCIKILFTQRDVSQVRGYLHRQLTKMLAGRVGLQDFVFAKEYRGMMGYKPSACVPALEIARRRLRTDRRAEPRVGERVPYVIVHGSPGLPLIQLVRQPRDLLRDPSLRINVTYYISKQVLPPLNRLLSLVGVSVFQWYNDMPKVIRLSPHVAPATTAQHSKQGTISQYFVTSDCLVCERQTKEAVCASCRQDPQLVTLTLASRSASYEALQHRLAQVCQTCMGVQDSTPPCVSLDCPVLFRRHLATLDLARADLHRDALLKLTF